MSEPEGRPDIVVYCAHGVQGERGDFVHRFRWVQTSGVWVTTAASAWSIVGGVEDFSSPEAIAAAPVGHEQWNPKCRKCHHRVTMRSDLGQITLTAIAGGIATADPASGIAITLRALQDSYESVSRRMRR